MARAIDLARHLGGGAPNSVAVMKRQLFASLRDDPHDIYFKNLDEFQKSMASEDFQEGVRSFMEKRPPLDGPLSGGFSPRRSPGR